ncbi:MAG TPA: hypothetical protein VFG01_04590 [Acidobacteriota bacterium]|nr:hypothetical protein [Acidobacteriota bacterium]
MPKDKSGQEENAAEKKVFAYDTQAVHLRTNRISTIQIRTVWSRPAEARGGESDENLTA